MLLLLLALPWPETGHAGERKTAEPRAVTPRGDLTAHERKVIDLFREASPAVVYITNIGVRQDLFSINAVEIPQGTGSGFVWDDRGHIVTNFHVIRNARAAEVTLADHSSWRAELVGAAPDKDLAVLKIDAPKKSLRPIPVGRSNDLSVGQSVLAIGNPFGLDQTLTTGVISALGREIQSVTRRPIRGVIQTDAAINPGNSGGPLLDSAGRLIGVNTQIFSPSGAFAGIGFAVPVDTVSRIVPQLIAHGKVMRPGLGITIAEDAVARRLGLTGVLAVHVPKGSSAARAGMRGTRRTHGGRLVLGDVIVSVDGKPVRGNDDLYRILDAHGVGDGIKLSVQRADGRHDIPVRLQALD